MDANSNNSGNEEKSRLDSLAYAIG